MQICMWMQRKALTGVAIAAAVLVSGTSLAGGYIGVDNTGQPYKWPGQIVLRFDQGPLGSFTKEQADALTMEALNAWMEPEIPGSNVHFVRGADLTEDHGDGAGTDPAWDPYAPHDGITPVIYDQNGALLDSILGATASSSVVGATDVIFPDDRSPAPLTEGILIMNGKLTPGSGGMFGGIPLESYKGAIIHELGHLINLGHAQAALAFTATGYDVGSPLAYLFEPPRIPPDYTGMPTMFPTVLPELQSLETDDIAWMKSLYGDATGQPLGSITGVVTTYDGLPFDGANMVAYSVDDPTSMVTCVSGYADPDAKNNPSGTFKIPGLPVGSKWIIDTEPIVDAFTGGSIVGPLDPPPALPGMPEFVNEAATESGSDQPSLSTTFAITPSQMNHTDARLQFNNPDDIDVVMENDLGTDEHTGQILPVTPGRMMFVQGVADPAEPNPQVYGVEGLYVYGHLYDFYRVKNPAGLELNLMMLDYQGSFLDAYLFEMSNSADSLTITSTASTQGASAVSLYVDSSRVGIDAANQGIFSFGIAFAGKDIGGSDPYQLTSYTLVLAFAVSDRDAVAVGGTATGTINIDSGSMQIKGRGFKNIGGAPLVSFTTPGITVTSVAYVDDHTLDVSYVKGPGFSPGETVLQVMNRPESGGYGGRIKQITTGEASGVTGWELY